MAEQPGGDYWLAVARILKARGRKGEVAVEILTDFPERFERLRRAFIEVPGSQPEPAEVAESWWHQGTLILRFAGVDSITQAERLRGRLILIPRGERVALGEHRYYWWELVGCEVVRRGGQPVGSVTGVEPTGGVDLLKVRAHGSGREGEELLIPLAQEICREIDVRARHIVIDPPEGLLELNEKPSGES